SPRCSRRTGSPTAPSSCPRRSFRTSGPTAWRRPVAGNAGSAVRWAGEGPRAVLALALLLGGITVGYAWVVARHLRDDARDTSRLLGRVFAGLNDPRPDAATGALLDLAAQVRSLGIPIAVTDTAGRVTALANAPVALDADPAMVRSWIAELDAVNTPLVQPGVGTIHYGPLPVAPRFPI